MKIISIAAAVGLPLAAALPSPQSQPAEQPGNMIWTGPITIGGGNVTLTGSLTSIYDEITKRNPYYDQELGRGSSHCDETTDLNVIVNPINWASIQCFDDSNGGELSDVVKSINVLRSLGGGLCGLAPRPAPPAGAGVRDGVNWDDIECGWDGGVALGNFANPHEHNLVPCSDLADNAVGIISTCAGFDRRGITRQVVPVSSGMIKSFDGSWGALVRKTMCL